MSSDNNIVHIDGQQEDTDNQSTESFVPVLVGVKKRTRNVAQKNQCCYRNKCLQKLPGDYVQARGNAIGAIMQHLLSCQQRCHNQTLVDAAIPEMQSAAIQALQCPCYARSAHRAHPSDGGCGNILTKEQKLTRFVSICACVQKRREFLLQLRPEERHGQRFLYSELFLQQETDGILR